MHTLEDKAAELDEYRLPKDSKLPFNPLHPVHTVQKHGVSRRFLEDSVCKGGDGSLVPLPLNAPSQRSGEDRQRADPLSAADAWNLGYMKAACRDPKFSSTSPA
ncbi:hypothetical protein ACQZ4Y_20440 [Rhizobium sp. L80/93]|uniref:hypothetical protein n=1 Tax=Rhizobium sp. E27B/91 TaxID=2819995 RepID=UPI001ADB8AA5|nr:hypothetical protein [Rhizobium sp. E27B/91]MBO9186863.1 hypothetical protein [Rhizobium sp. E27B/91]